MFAAGTALESDEAVFQWQDLHKYQMASLTNKNWHL